VPDTEQMSIDMVSKVGQDLADPIPGGGEPL
jgi:hypothetical protein